MNMIKKNKVLVAMSGGVDSSVTAKLLVDKGYECIGATMKLYNNEDILVPKEHSCCSLFDVEDARSVAYKLGMKYYVFNYSEGFNEKIIQKFVRSYLEGKTPNPCIDCNKYMKFDKLYKQAKTIGCEYIATGHYARIEKVGDKFLLKKAIDESKDQSYVLYGFTQEQLSHTLFPLGSLTKLETRKIAEENGFVNADKPDSQDICFVPDGDYAKIVEKYSNKKIEGGNIVDKNGNILGKHNGIINYTIGQRKGLKISSPKPLYVCSLCPFKNEVVVGESDDLFEKQLFAEDFNWISGEVPKLPLKCKAKIRYRSVEQPATVDIIDNKIRIIFDEPQRAITPGQSVVLYDGDIVLGGGIIVKY